MNKSIKSFAGKNSIMYIDINKIDAISGADESNKEDKKIYIYVNGQDRPFISLDSMEDVLKRVEWI